MFEQYEKDCLLSCLALIPSEENPQGIYSPSFLIQSAPFQMAKQPLELNLHEALGASDIKHRQNCIITAGCLIKQEVMIDQSEERAKNLTARQQKKIWQRRRLREQCEALNQCQFRYYRQKKRLQIAERKRKIKANKKLQAKSKKLASRQIQTVNVPFLSLQMVSKQDKNSSKQPLKSTGPLATQQQTSVSTAMTVQYSLTEAEELILFLAVQLEMMNNSFLRTVLPISREQGEDYFIKNSKRLTSRFKFILQHYESYMFHFYQQRNQTLVTLFETYLEKNGIETQDYSLLMEQKPTFQSEYSLFGNYEWRELKEN